jgi:hypothetical protein
MSRLGEIANMPAMFGHFLRHGIDPSALLVRERELGSGRVMLRYTDDQRERALPRTDDPHAFFRARRFMRHLHRAGEAN